MSSPNEARVAGATARLLPGSFELVGHGLWQHYRVVTYTRSAPKLRRGKKARRHAARATAR